MVYGGICWGATEVPRNSQGSQRGTGQWGSALHSLAVLVEWVRTWKEGGREGGPVDLK